MTVDMSQYLQLFIDETRENLQALNEALLLLEKNPGDTQVLNEIFRIAHTIKGTSGTMGFNRMATLTHDMENVLQVLRSGEVRVTSRLVDLLFKCLDALETYLGNVITTGSEGDMDSQDIIEELKRFLEGKSGEEKEGEKGQGAKAEEPSGQDSADDHPTANFQLNQYEQNVIKKAIEMGMNIYRITVVLDKGCVLKSARAFLVFNTLEKFSEIIKSVPIVEDIEDERFDFEFTVVVITKETQDFFVKKINNIAEIRDVIVHVIHSAASAEGESRELAERRKEDAGAAPDGRRSDRGNADDGSGSRKPRVGKTVRVDITRLDSLMNLVSELIIQKTRLEGMEQGERSQEYSEALEALERVTTDLHDAVMRVRMVPLETVFNRFPRTIRDISRDLGKDVEFHISGEETELDRTIIDEIGDPLIHLLRNSVGHGIEPVERRLQLGKPRAGQIYLRAYQDGNNVVIEVEDDGQGIDVPKVKRKAVERGLIAEDAAERLTEKEAFDFLFHPSFSTADKVTDLQGRGVGLDVVKTKIEALGGTVEIDSERDRGAKFIIRIPLTLAIIQALMVLVGNEKYAIPISSISSIVRVAPDEIRMVQKQEVILVRNMVIPLVRLDRLLEVKKEEKQQKLLKVILVKKREKLYGLLVDNLLGQQEIVVKSVGKLLSGIKAIAGATILGDGNVAFILDVASIV